MRSIVTALAAVVALSLSTGVASADSGLEFDDTSATLTFPDLRFSGGLGVDIVCPVTLDVTLHQSVAKTTATLAGFADIAVGTGRCTEGNAGLLEGRSRLTEIRGFHVDYLSFAGTLPNIQSILLELNDVTFWIQNSSVSCLTDVGEDVIGATTGGNPATGFVVSNVNVDLRTVVLVCDLTRGTLNGEGTLDEAVGITLI